MGLGKAGWKVANLLMLRAGTPKREKAIITDIRLRS